MQGLRRIFKGGVPTPESQKKIWMYPLLGGTKFPIWAPNFGYICYSEDNLIVIEKCYSWQNCCETDV